MRSRLLLALLALLSAAGTSRAQAQYPLTEALEDAKNHTSIFYRLFFPGGMREGYILRNFILSDGFKAYLDSTSSQDAFDLIYDAAIQLTHGETSDAALASMVGTFEHQYVPLKLPGFVLPIPLTIESDARFKRRVSHLPRSIYGAKGDDRDKLQHFFANTWLKRALGFHWLVKLFGELVERGESGFVQGGVNDDRDKAANRDGMSFGIRGEDDLGVTPSQFLSPNP